jgi:hypothetical protein
MLLEIVSCAEVITDAMLTYIGSVLLCLERLMPCFKGDFYLCIICALDVGGLVGGFPA